MLRRKSRTSPRQRDPHPDVIRNAMLNPRLREPLVVQLAARRPNTAAILEELTGGLQDPSGDSNVEGGPDFATADAIHPMKGRMSSR